MTDDGDPPRALERRVYQPELEKLMGVSGEWIRQLEKAGKIPAARRDPGGTRKFWLESEARRIIEGRVPGGGK